MSKLIYDGYTIEYLTTRDVSFEDQYTDDQQDYLCTKVTVNVSGLITATNVGITTAANNRAIVHSAAGSFQILQHALEQPRKALQLLDGAGLPILEADSDTDVKNGPFPKVLSISRVDGADAIAISYSIVTYRYDCADHPGAQKPVYTSNRYREDEDRDNQFLAKRTRSGKIQILGGAEFKAIDTLRAVCVPPIPKGWVRDKVSFAVQEDGLAMSYTIQDHEVIQTAPSPAVEADGSFVDTHPWPGAVRYGTATMKLKGTKETPTNFMVLTAVSLIFKKLTSAGGDFKKRDRNTGREVDKAFAAELSIRHNYMSNTVEVSARSMLKPYVLKSEIDPTKFQHFTTKNWPDEGSPAFQIESGIPLKTAETVDRLCGFNGVLIGAPRGNAAAILVAQRIAAQLGNRGAIGAAGAVGVAGDPGRMANSTTYIVPVAPDPTETVNAFVDGGAYTVYDVRPRFQTHHGKVGLPGTSEDSDVAFVQLHQKTMRLRLEWSAERIGEPPAIPSKNLVADSGPELMDEDESPGMIEQLPGGAILYRVAGCYYYEFRRPDLVKKQAAVTPWTRDVANAASLAAGGLAGAITNLFIDAAAQDAFTNVSDKIFSVGNVTADRVDGFNAAVVFLRSIRQAEQAAGVSAVKEEPRNEPATQPTEPETHDGRVQEETTQTALHARGGLGPSGSVSTPAEETGGPGIADGGQVGRPGRPTWRPHQEEAGGRVQVNRARRSVRP